MNIRIIVSIPRYSYSDNYNYHITSMIVESQIYIYE